MESKSHIRILVVDDEASGRLSLVRLLEQSGYAIDSAEDGFTALRIVAEHPPDLVITDLRMPGMDGIQLLSRLKDRIRDLPVIIVTSLGDIESAVAAMRAGAEEYLSKPIDADALELLLERVLERRDLRVEAENMRRQVLAQQERLRLLYEISKQLARFDTIARTVPEVLARIGESVPLRTAVLMVEQRAVPENRTHSILWHADDVDAARLSEATAHAKMAYAYLVHKNSSVEEESGVTLLPSTPPPPGGRKAGFVFLPLAVEHRQLFGALQVEGAAGLDEADLAFLDAMVDHLATALARMAAIEAKQEAAEAGRRAAEFLADASATLFSSLGYENTIASVARAGVPVLGDMCFLDLVDGDERLRRVATQLAHHSQVSSTERGRPRGPSADPNGPEAEALRLGKPVLISGFDISSDDATRADVVGELGGKSMMAVPLVTRGRRLGVLTFVATDSQRRFAASDLALAEEIGRRAAIAIDNAELYEQAQRAIRARQDLLAIVSHDLRNPLHTILMATSILTSARETEFAAHAELLEVIERSAKRMHRLVGDLLDIASIEAGKLSVEVKGCPAADLVSEAVELHGVEAAQKRLRLERVVPSKEFQVECDRDRVLQVLGNLIGNAVKFTPREGSIRVTVETRGGEALFSVADSGPGIEPEGLAHVFDRFWQAKKTARLGTGLGLTITKGLVEAQGGRIWAESTVGKGATFFFTIPALNASVAHS